MKVLEKYSDSSEFGFRVQHMDIVLLDLIAFHLRNNKMIASSNWINELDQIAVLRCFVQSQDPKIVLEDVFLTLEKIYKNAQFCIHDYGFSSPELTTLELQFFNRVIQSESESYAFHYKFIESYTLDQVCSKGKFSHLIDYTPINQLAVYRFDIQATELHTTLVPSKSVSSKLLKKITKDLSNELLLVNKTITILYLFYEKKCIVLDPVNYEYRTTIQDVFFRYIPKIDEVCCGVFELQTRPEGHVISQLAYASAQWPIALPINDIPDGMHARGWIVSKRGRGLDKFRKTIAHACTGQSIRFELRKPGVSYSDVLEETLANVDKIIAKARTLLTF